MGTIYHFTETQLLAFVLVMMRIGGFMLSWPVLSGSLIPRPPLHLFRRRFQVLLTFVITMVAFPVVGWQSVGEELVSGSVAWLVVREVFIGLAMGVTARFFLYAVSIMGEIISLTMGLSGAQMYNPAMGSRATVIEQFQVMLASLFFLAINGHHYFMAALFKTYEVLPITVKTLSTRGLTDFAVLVQEITVAGVKMSAPVVAAVFFMNIAMGIIGRAVPQINVLITSLPVNILLGFGVLLISLPFFIHGLESYLELVLERTFQLIRSF